MDTTTAAEPVLKNLNGLIPDLEALYKDVHAHPELSMQETRTAGLAADRLRAAGYEVTTGVGKTGVVGLLRNGDGPTAELPDGRSHPPKGKKRRDRPNDGWRKCLSSIRRHPIKARNVPDQVPKRPTITLQSGVEKRRKCP